jgi:hypothetical protein
MSLNSPLTTQTPNQFLPLEEQETPNFMKLILSTLKNEEDLTLKDKLDFSFILSISKGNFTEETIKEFCEEECHLALLNWVWKYAKKLKKFKLESELREKYLLNRENNFEEFFQKYNILLIEINFILDLLINILNLFSFLPITSTDLLNLKLYQKLQKIKSYINSFSNINILNTIDFVLNKWRIQIDSENEQKIFAKFMLNKLGIKRKRNWEVDIEDRETEINSVEDEDNLNSNNINNISINNKKKFNLNNKKNKVSFDLNKNSVIYYKKTDMPFQITIDKINKINNASSNE